jgi:hypothetical protein
MNTPSRSLSRRTFLTLGLKLGLMTACCGYFPTRLLAATDSPDVMPLSPAQAKRLQTDFQGLSQGVQAWLTPPLGPKEAAVIAANSRTRFAALLPDIPNIGPGNRNQESLVETVQLTAVTQAMQARDLPAVMAGRLFYDLCERELRQRSAAQMQAKGQTMFTPEGRSALAAWARGTQAHRHPGDWVATAVFGDGKRFDVGYDYAECGAVKFFRAHGVAAVAPYFCLNDFTISRAQGTGLTRAHTIGQGDGLCDFRYKKDGPVTQSWDTEAPRFANLAL